MGRGRGPGSAIASVELRPIGLQLSDDLRRRYSLADAEHVLKAANKHWPALQALGATDAERKRIGALIAEAARAAAQGIPGPIRIEEAREALRELLGTKSTLSFDARVAPLPSCSC